MVVRLRVRVIPELASLAGQGELAVGCDPRQVVASGFHVNGA